MSAADSGGKRMLGVLGAGTMGVGLAALAVGRGQRVVLVESDDGQRAAAPGRVRGQLRTAQLLGALPREQEPGELLVTADLDELGAIDPAAGAVVESVTERADLKGDVLAAASAAAKDGTLITTNTSAIPVGELAAAVTDPAWLVGTHFMNPPYLVEAVEVVRGPDTGEEAMTAVHALLASLGRRAVVVGDGPGFVSNRILMRMINDAARMVGEGRAEPAALDEVFTDCLGHRMGPLATADLIGLDNVVDTLVVLHERTGDDAYRPCGPLLTAVGDGRLGRKSGEGFHSYGGVRA
jgi:methoxymalonate biosynthesis protein